MQQRVMSSEIPYTGSLTPRMQAGCTLFPKSSLLWRKLEALRSVLVEDVRSMRGELGDTGQAM